MPVNGKEGFDSLPKANLNLEEDMLPFQVQFGRRREVIS